MNIKLRDTVRSINPEGKVKVRGTVVAIYDAEFYLETQRAANVTKEALNVAWCRYPEWFTKPVVVVRYNEPQRTATLKEWIDGAKAKGYSAERAKREYETKCPFTQVITFPLDDLEIVE